MSRFSNKSGLPAILLCNLISSSALSQETNEDQITVCNKYLDAASNLWAQKQYSACTNLLEKIYPLCKNYGHSETILLNIARGYFRIGNYSQTLKTYERYKNAIGTKQPADEEFDRVIQVMRASHEPPKGGGNSRKPGLAGVTESSIRGPGAPLRTGPLEQGQPVSEQSGGVAAPKVPQAAVPNLSAYRPTRELHESRSSLLPRPAPPRPIYKRWWVWTISGVSLGAIVIALAVTLRPPPAEQPVDCPGPILFTF